MANETDASPPAEPPEYRIHEASLGPHGAVVKGKEISQAEAEVMRKAGQDVVVCGPELATNRRVATEIEKNANGAYKRCPPHPAAGPHALPHCQPDPRPPAGHTFYETPNRKAVKSK